MDDLYDDLLEIAGRSEPSQKRRKASAEKARKRRKAQFSSDDETDNDLEADEADSDEEMDEDSDASDEEGGSNRRRQSGADTPKSGRSMPLKKRVAQQEDDDDEDEDNFEERIRQELGYGADLYKSEADREELGRKSELEREMELADRAEKRDELLQQRELQMQQRARAQEGAGGTAAMERRPKPARESRAVPAKRDSRERRQTTQQQRSNKDALQELKALRERKGLATTGAEEKQRKKQKSRSGRARDEEDEDYDENEASEEEVLSEEEAYKEEEEEKLSEEDEEDAAPLDRLAPRRAQDSDDEEAEADDDPVCDRGMLESVTITRTTLEKWHKEPFFSDTLSSCYVRISIGMDPDRNVVYRVASVVKVLTGSHEGKQLAPYEFPSGSMKHTGKWLLLEIGKSRRPFRMDTISNQPITEPEFLRWINQLNKDLVPVPRKSDFEELIAKIAQANEFRYTSAEVKKILEEKKAEGKGPTNYTVEKSRKVFLRDQARERGDMEEVARLDQEIEVLDVKLKEVQARMTKLTNLNSRNKLNNELSVYNAAMQKKAMASEGTGKTTNDPFSRRPTQLSNYWTTKSQQPAAAPESSVSEEMTQPGLEAAKKPDEEDAPEATMETKSGKDMAVWLAESHKSCLLTVDLSLVKHKTEDAPLAAKWRLPAAHTPFNMLQAHQLHSLSLEEYRKTQGIEI
mmetsp:Transcript_20759/g.39474  ORF Transcript_20759/g.39474 Transcript_20759/m.39474 type:complete len:690 (+) Transcript_20759:77-2146(+)